MVLSFISLIIVENISFRGIDDTIVSKHVVTLKVEIVKA